MNTTPDVRSVFIHLREHCARLMRDYNTYTNLFNEQSHEVLSRTAPTFFSDISEILQRDWILQACKLADPAVSKRKDGIHYNISIHLLNQQLKALNLLNLEISNLGDAITGYAERLKPARDKRIAHYDFSHQIQDVFLGETSEADLLNFLDAIQRYFDFVGEALGLGPLDLSPSGCPGDELDLLKLLRRVADHG